MPYAEKVVGALCNQCKQGKYVRNPKTGKVFCEKKCWLGVSSQAENAVERKNEAISVPSSFDMATIKDLQVKVDGINLVIANFRTWAKTMENRLEALETLTAPLTSEDAKELHKSLAGKSKTIQMAADMLDGTVIDQVPEGL